MISLKIFHINTFSSEDFKGNPAGVVPMDFWISDDLMQKIANQNGLSETAFFVKTVRGFAIRWFTPEVEVPLCGHATLASGYVLTEFMNHPDERILFESKSGDLEFVKKDGLFYLDFPAFESHEISLDFPFQKALGVQPQKVYQANEDIMAVFRNEEEIAQIRPDFHALLKLKGRGLIVTAPGKKVDFVSRFFAPSLGINEDAVTGSSFTKLFPYWSKELGKTEFQAMQISERTGKVTGQVMNGRVLIGGEAMPYLKGEIYIKS
ncbi:PhzF family phenazine biosynthesis protein [Leadbetterella byssophila]|uniref:PhzF family phenazine biosynthesis protein n=1 Tax=Leadbetterella byssophila TaxID=316068 RepID=UPI0039A1A8BC